MTRRWFLPGWIAFAVALVLMWVSLMDSFTHGGLFAPQRWFYILDAWIAVAGIPWLTGILIMLTGYIVGDRILDRIIGSPAQDLEESVYGIGRQPHNPILSIAIGLGVMSWVTYLIGLSGWLRWEVFVGLGVIVWIWGWRSFYPLITSLRDGLRGILSWHWTEKVLFGVIVWYICRTLPSVTNPATGWDECNSHLVLPKLYVQTGVIEFYEWVNFSNFPPFFHMLLTIQRMFTETPGAVITYLFHIGTLAVIWMLVRDVITWRLPVAYPNFVLTEGVKNSFEMRASYIPALLACILYLMVPMVTQSSQAVLVDPVLTFYCALLLWWVLKQDFNEHAVITGILAGVVLSIKYTGIIWVAVLFIPSMIYKRNWTERWYYFDLIVVALLFCSPWMIRNVMLFGNPIFPTLDSFIPTHWGTVAPDIQVQLAVNYWSMLGFFNVWNLNPLELLGLADPAPWTSGNSRPDETGPWMLIGVPLIFLIWKDLSRAGRIAILIGLAYIAVWLLGIQIMQTRYWMPAFPVLCAGIGVAVVKLMEDK